MPDAAVTTALVVDDNYYNRDLCRLALEHAGISVVEAKNGRDAMNWLRRQTFDLLVLDLAMPELNGIGVIRELSHQSEHKGMSVIVMTANPHMATDEVAREVDFVLHKPIDILDFTALALRLTNRPC